MVCVKMDGWLCEVFRGDLRGDFMVDEVLGRMEVMWRIWRIYGGYMGSFLRNMNKKLF